MMRYAMGGKLLTHKPKQDMAQAYRTTQNKNGG
jgi:hypothetical protein